MPNIKKKVESPKAKPASVRQEVNCKCGNIISVIPSRLAAGELVQCFKCGKLFAHLSEVKSIWKPNQTK